MPKHRKTPSRSITASRAVGLTLLLTGGAHQLARAQAAEDSGRVKLPEVTITAERSETKLHKTPVSVGVIDQNEIQAKGIFQLNDIVGVVAGVAVPNGYSNMPQAVAIRGVGVSIPAMTQAVGIYVDDVPLIRGYATALWDLPDIQRIEVLRGPQGTLYGQNATAGAVKLVSMDPSAQKSAWFAAGVGNLGALEARGYVNGALGDGPLTASLAFSRRSNSGFAHNATTGQDINKLDATQFRAKLRVQAGPDTSAVLALDGLQDRSDANTTNFPLNHPNAAPRVSYTSVDAGDFKRNAGGLNLTVEHRLSKTLKLRAITGYRAYTDDPTVADWGGLEQQRYTLSQRIDQKAFSQEIQLQGSSEALSWSAGTTLVSDRFSFGRFVTSQPLAASSPSYTEAQTRLSTVDLGIYGQGRYALSESTGVTFGARAYRTRQSGSNAFYRTDVNHTRTTQVYMAPDLSTNSSGALPRIGIDHQWSPETFLYASIARGEKFAGFNRAAESLNAARVAAVPEKVTTYELGSKSRFDGGRFTANVAAFYNDYRDYLAALTNSTVNGVLVTDAVLSNAGRAKTYGIDLELAAKLTRDTRWTLSAEALRSRFDDFANPTGAAATNYVGHQLPNAPQLSLGMGVDHTQHLSGGDALMFELSTQYIHAQYSDVANTALLKIPTQTYVNTAASYLPANRSWSLSMRIRNLTNRTYVLSRNRIPPLGVDAAYYNAPRTLMFDVRYDF